MSEELNPDEAPTVIDRSPVPPPPPARGRGLWPLAAALAALALVGVGVALALGGGAAGWAWWSRAGSSAPEPSDGLDPRRRPVPEQEGPLAGLVIYLSAGHGYLLHREHHDGLPLRWGLQRDAWNGIIEDIYTANFVADQLAPRLEEAGATVITLRERDRNPVSVVVDDSDPTRFAAFGARDRDLDELAVGGTATRIGAGGVATWSLTVPEEGHWTLYTRWVEGHDLDAQAIYTVRAGVDVVEEVVDQRAHGGHWWKLYDGSLPAGTPVEVTLSGSGGASFSADAVRLGGGTLDLVLEPDYILRQHKAFDVSFAQSYQHLGGPEHVGLYDCGNPRSDMRLRPHWVAWASPPHEEAIYLSIHTNGGRGQGAIVFAGIDSTPPTPPRPGSERLALAVEQHLLASGQTVDPTYASKGMLWGDYSEISPVHNPLPAILIELAFHDHPADARRLRDPRMQAAMAAGIVEGVVSWRDDPGAYPLP